VQQLDTLSNMRKMKWVVNLPSNMNHVHHFPIKIITNISLYLLIAQSKKKGENSKSCQNVKNVKKHQDRYLKVGYG